MDKKDITIGYTCLDCKKVFKKHKYIRSKDGNWKPIDYKGVCPQCSNQMYETVSAFKAPQRTDKKNWKQLKSRFESGYKFHPNFGNPFEESASEKKEKSRVPQSEFRKPARKRIKSA